MTHEQADPIYTHTHTHSHTHTFSLLLEYNLQAATDFYLFCSMLDSAIPKGKRGSGGSGQPPWGQLLYHYYYLKFLAHHDDKKQILVEFVVLKFSTDNAFLTACTHLLPLVPDTSQVSYKC